MQKAVPRRRTKTHIHPRGPAESALGLLQALACLGGLVLLQALAAQRSPYKAITRSTNRYEPMLTDCGFGHRELGPAPTGAQTTIAAAAASKKA